MQIDEGKEDMHVKEVQQDSTLLSGQKVVHRLLHELILGQAG